MIITTQIGRPVALFILPGDRFINATKPLRESSSISIDKEAATNVRTSRS